MGLESFTSDDSTGDWNSGGGNSNNKSKNANHGNEHNAFKIIWNGKNTIPIEQNEIVIQTKEEWTKILDFINNSMGISDSAFNSKPKERRYEIVEDAVTAINKTDRDVYSQTEECHVCGEVFKFPEDWNFIEIDGIIVCPSHKVGEALKECEEMGEVKNGA